MASVAAVKIEQKKAGISDADYRRLLLEMFSAQSCRELNDRQRATLIRAMNDDKTPQERKIWAIWYDLLNSLPKEQRNVRYLVGFCRRAAGVTHEITRLADLTPGEMRKAIEALKRRVEAAEPVPF